MKESPNLASLCPLEEGLTKLPASAKALTSIGVPVLLGTLIVPLEPKGPNLGEFQSKLTKVVLDQLWCEFY